MCIDCLIFYRSVERREIRLRKQELCWYWTLNFWIKVVLNRWLVGSKSQRFCKSWRSKS